MQIPTYFLTGKNKMQALLPYSHMDAITMGCAGAVIGVFVFRFTCCPVSQFPSLPGNGLGGIIFTGEVNTQGPCCFTWYHFFSIKEIPTHVNKLPCNLHLLEGFSEVLQM